MDKNESISSVMCDTCDVLPRHGEWGRQEAFGSKRKCIQGEVAAQSGHEIAAQMGDGIATHLCHKIAAQFGHEIAAHLISLRCPAVFDRDNLNWL